MQIDTEAILNELLETVIEDEGLKNSEVVIKPISSGGANYTSTLYSITVKIPGGEDLELFAKVACLGEHVRNVMRAERFFANERFFYRDLRKIYEDLQVRSKIPEDRRLCLPKFYACSDKRFKETLILENLIAKGYALYDRHKSVTWEYAAAAMDELGKLHALSYAFAADDPEKFTEVAAKSEMMFTGCEEELDKMWQKSEANALNALPEHMNLRLKAFLTKESGSKGFLNYSITNRRPVLLHGDYRPSNLLHKMADGKLEKLIPVDYQTMYSGPIMCDIYYFIFAGTDGEFRRQHFRPLLDRYYTSFADFLQKLHQNPEKLYPREHYEEDLKKFLPYGLLIAVLFLPLILVDEECAPSFDGDVQLSELVVEPNKIYKKRFLEVVEDFVEWGIL